MNDLDINKYSIYLTNINGNYYCKTEEELNKEIKTLGVFYNNIQFKKVDNIQEVLMCRQLRNFPKSADCKNPLIVNNNIKKVLSDDYFISSQRGDIKFTSEQMNNIPEVSNIVYFLNPLDFLSIKKELYFSPNKVGTSLYFFMYLKFVWKYENGSHTILVKLSVNRTTKTIFSIEIADTASFVEPYDPLWLKSVIYEYLKRSDLDKYVFMFDNVEIFYPIKKYNIYIQELENQLTNTGYCNAWLYYFIWKNGIFELTFDEIYQELVTRFTDIERTILIMTWWDSVMTWDSIAIANFDRELNIYNKYMKSKEMQVEPPYFYKYYDPILNTDMFSLYIRRIKYKTKNNKVKYRYDCKNQYELIKELNKHDNNFTSLRGYYEVNTPGDFQKCLMLTDRYKTYKENDKLHPGTYSVNTTFVEGLKKLQLMLPDNCYLTLEINDLFCNNTDISDITNKWTIIKTEETQKMLNMYLEQAIKSEKFFFYIKVGSPSHIFIMKITTNYNNVISIEIIDTAEQESTGKIPDQYVQNFILHYFNNQLLLPSNVPITYPINDFQLYLQEFETDYLYAGYCAAWSLYFVWKNAITGMSYDQIYYELKTKFSEIQRTILILVWWDLLVNLNTKDLMDVDRFELPLSSYIPNVVPELMDVDDLEYMYTDESEYMDVDESEYMDVDQSEYMDTD